VNETDLQAAFAQIRSQDAPPHGLTPDALLAAGKQAQLQRRQMITTGAILAAVLAAITPVLLGLIMSTGTHPAPATSVDPTGVVSSQPNVPGRTLPTAPNPMPSPDATSLHSGATSNPLTPGAGAPSPTAGSTGSPRGAGSRGPGASPTNPGAGSQAPATPSPHPGTAAPSPNPG
jgi:hypothetical protein